MKECIIEADIEGISQFETVAFGKVTGELIRCKDCKNNPSTLIGWIECPMTGAVTRQPNDFCSYAKPKEKER